MATLNPYLLFDGTCQEAFNFYKTAFGTEFNALSFFKDMPADKPLTAADQNKIMHVSLPINDNVCLMGADVSPVLGNSASRKAEQVGVSVECVSSQEADQLYEKLSAGGTVVVPLKRQFWGALYGMFVDKFGVTWMINYKKAD